METIHLTLLASRFIHSSCRSILTSVRKWHWVQSDLMNKFAFIFYTSIPSKYLGKIPVIYTDAHLGSSWIECRWKWNALFSSLFWAPSFWFCTSVTLLHSGSKDSNFLLNCFQKYQWKHKEDVTITTLMPFPWIYCITIPLQPLCACWELSW